MEIPGAKGTLCLMVVPISPYEFIAAFTKYIGHLFGIISDALAVPGSCRIGLCFFLAGIVKGT